MEKSNPEQLYSRLAELENSDKNAFHALDHQTSLLKKNFDEMFTPLEGLQKQ